MRTFALLCCLGCGMLSAADIYVAPPASGGNDTTGTGSLAAPYATLARAQQAAAVGDTIHFRNGTYVGGGYFTKNNITYQSYTGEWAIIELPNNVSGQDNAFYLGTASNCTIRRLELKGGYFYALKVDTGPCLIEDCKIHGSGRDCVKIPGSDNITIRRCEIYDSGQRDPSNAEGIDNVNGDNMLVQDCYIHDIATNGVYPKGGSIGSIIERCLIRRCGQKGISMAQSSGLAFYDTTANPEYYSCRDCIARNNIIEDCEGSGIDLESALRAKVYNNTLINVAKSQNGGIRIASVDKGPPAGVVPCTDCEIRNNIIVLGSTSPRPMLFMGNNSHTGTLTMSNNRYYKTGGTAVYWWEPLGQYNLTLAGWKTSSGTDGNSTEGDPLLSASWHLNTGSPCIDAAMTITGFSNDYDGNTRTAPWDIGADETSGTPLTTPPPAGTIGTGGGGTPPPPTTAPQITSSAPTTATAGTAYTYTVTMSGNPTPTLAATGLPAWLTLAGNTLSGTPGAGDVGTAGPITLTASNGVLPNATQVFSITVSAAGGGGGGSGGSGGGGGGGGGCRAAPDWSTPLWLLVLAWAMRRVQTRWRPCQRATKAS